MCWIILIRMWENTFRNLNRELSFMLFKNFPRSRWNGTEQKSSTYAQFIPKSNVLLMNSPRESAAEPRSITNLPEENKFMPNLLKTHHVISWSAAEDVIDQSDLVCHIFINKKSGHHENRVLQRAVSWEPNPLDRYREPRCPILWAIWHERSASPESSGSNWDTIDQSGDEQSEWIRDADEKPPIMNHRYPNSSRELRKIKRMTCF